MTRDEAAAILHLPKAQAIDIILALAHKAEKYDQLSADISPTTPSGMTPVYLKQRRGKRKKKHGRKMGHPGISRSKPERVNHSPGSYFG